MTTSDNNRSKEGTWAEPVDRMAVGQVPDEAINLNVDGRQPTGPLQGFGQMWQKTYRVRLGGAEVKPAEVIETWKNNFPQFWPEGNRFYGPLTGVTPGEVALLNVAAPGGLKLSTGIRVIYADDESFSFMTPQGHMFAGMITFSAYEEEGVTAVQIQALIRASDPVYEVSFRLGFGHKMEDQFWHDTLMNLADYFDAEGQYEQEAIRIDKKMQWSEAKNVWHNAAIRTALYTPVHMTKRLFSK
jgi:hypothetical protein